MKAPTGKYVEEILSDAERAKELMAHLIVGGRVNKGETVTIGNGKYEITKVSLYSSINRNRK